VIFGNGNEDELRLLRSSFGGSWKRLLLCLNVVGL
jgi:hypothetical protein